jgi:hypothetical protein
MTKPRFAIECWFFGASEFPMSYAPIAASTSIPGGAMSSRS